MKPRASYRLRLPLPGRIAIAGSLVAVALGVPLAFMWVSGEAAAEAEHDKILAAPEQAAKAAAERIARRVAGELADLAEREGTRPYYQWQSLIVDPRGAYEGEAVVPSPLAEGPTEPLVLSHFQLDATGAVTSPEVNEAKGAPEAKPVAVERLGWLRTALNGRRAEQPNQVAPPPANDPQGTEPVQVAVQADEPAQEDWQVQQGDVDNVQLANAAPTQQPRLQEQRVSNAVYKGNAEAPELFEQIQQQKRPAKKAVEPGQVTVRVGPFEWEALALDGKEVLAATRAVETPDAPKRQGFVIDPGRLATLLSEGEVRGRIDDLEHARDGANEVTAPLPLAGVAKVIAVPLPDRAALAASAEAPLHDFRLRSIVLSVLAVIAALAIVFLIIQSERLLERRQRFAAAAAHELRTPLAGLRMYAEMLAHGLGKPEKQKAYAERLASEAARLGRVVANVLDFTRLERKSLAVSATVQDLAAQVEDLVRKLEPSIVAAGATLVFERPSGPVMALVDADALAQILGNLVDNAEKYTRDCADRTITVSVRAGETPAVHVRDRGPGLPEPRRLFRPFKRGGNKDAPAGLGLGLALARALARAQGGDLVSGDARPGAELVVRFAPPG